MTDEKDTKTTKTTSATEAIRHFLCWHEKDKDDLELPSAVSVYCRAFPGRIEKLIISLLEEGAYDRGFRAGWERGVGDFAVWENGKQVVGVTRSPLKLVLDQGPINAS